MHNFFVLTFFSLEFAKIRLLIPEDVGVEDPHVQDEAASTMFNGVDCGSIPLGRRGLTVASATLSIYFQTVRTGTMQQIFPCGTYAVH